MNGKQLARAVYKAFDAKDLEAFGNYLTEDCWYAFSNWPAMEGREAALYGVSAFFKDIKATSHTIQDVWEDADTIILRIVVVYHRKDGQLVSLPCVNIWERVGDQISDFRIYMDVNPVFVDV